MEPSCWGLGSFVDKPGVVVSLVGKQPRNWELDTLDKIVCNLNGCRSFLWGAKRPKIPIDILSTNFNMSNLKPSMASYFFTFYNVSFQITKPDIILDNDSMTYES